MKAILISIKPRYAQLILGKTKTIEIRKRFPKDFKGWVYIYHTKAKNPNEWLIPAGAKRTKENDCSGKVVARFWCDKVEEYYNGQKWTWKFGVPLRGSCNDYKYILEDACITRDELYDYCEDSFKAIHINKLEIFNYPKEISDFCVDKIKSCSKSGCPYYATNKCLDAGECHIYSKLTRAPQSWQYIEVEE